MLLMLLYNSFNIDGRWMSMANLFGSVLLLWSVGELGVAELLSWSMTSRVVAALPAAESNVGIWKACATRSLSFVIVQRAENDNYKS